MAHSRHAGWYSLLFAVGGLGLGLVVALILLKLTSTELSSTKTGFVGGIVFLTYCLLPLASSAVATFATSFLTQAILCLFQ